MKILPARMGPTVCDELGPTVFVANYIITSCDANQDPCLPPILNKSNAEMTACSACSLGPSCNELYPSADTTSEVSSFSRSVSSLRCFARFNGDTWAGPVDEILLVPVIRSFTARESWRRSLVPTSALLRVPDAMGLASRCAVV